MTNPLTGERVFATPIGASRTRLRIIALIGTSLVLEAGPGKELTVLNATSGRQQAVPWPDTAGTLDKVAVDPRGSYVALSFGNPSWTVGRQQYFDVWILDARTARVARLPGMPALVALKRTSISWTDDGRLVVLADSGGREIVAVWTPGQKRLHAKAVRLPNRAASGSDSFAVVG